MASPVITPVDPTKNATGVPSGSAVQFTLIGDENIDLPWSVSIDRGAGLELAFTYDGAAHFEPQFQGRNSVLTIVSAKSYDLTIHPRTPFIQGQVVTVEVVAEDVLGQAAVVV